GGAAARQRHRRDGRPVALQEQLTRVTVEKLSVDRDLTDLDAHLIAGEPLFKPKLGKARRRLRLDRGDGVDAADIVSAHPSVVVNGEKFRKERQALPAGELAEIDGDDALQLALVDGAGLVAAMNVGQHVIGVFETVDDAALVKPFTVAGGVALGGKARRDR